VEVDSKVLDVFLDALTQIFSETGITIDSVTDANRRDSSDQVVTSIGFAGGIKGNLMLCTDSAAAANIVKAMMGGMQLSIFEGGLREIHKTALGELSNQISGRAVTILSQNDLECDITPPIIITGRDLSSHVPDIAEAFSRVVKGPFGSLRLLLALTECELPDREKPDHASDFEPENRPQKTS
jgi:chemotaxis protein CheX